MLGDFTNGEIRSIAAGYSFRSNVCQTFAQLMV
jgi:hypothetical protein